MSNIDEVLQVFSDYLLDDVTMSHHNNVQRDQMWALFETMLLQSPPSELRQLLLQAQNCLHDIKMCDSATGFGQGFRFDELDREDN